MVTDLQDLTNFGTAVQVRFTTVAVMVCNRRPCDACNNGMAAPLYLAAAMYQGFLGGPQWFYRGLEDLKLVTDSFNNTVLPLMALAVLCLRGSYNQEAHSHHSLWACNLCRGSWNFKSEESHHSQMCIWGMSYHVTHLFIHFL